MKPPKGAGPVPLVAGPQAALIFMLDCPLLSLQRAHLKRSGFRLTTLMSPECGVLVLCPDHLKEFGALGAARMDAPKIVVGGAPPEEWSRTEGLAGPVLPWVLERRIVELLKAPAAQDEAEYRLLMVDDDATVRAAVEGAFHDAGFSVRSVDGWGSVLAAMSPLPDVIVMDLNLPSLSGEKLGEILQHKGVPTVILSSEPPERLETARKRIGAFAAFSKGTPLHDVASRIRGHLDALRRDSSRAHRPAAMPANTSERPKVAATPKSTSERLRDAAIPAYRSDELKRRE